MESVFYLLSEMGKDVFLIPRDSDFERYLSAHTEPIVIEPLITESPLLTAGKLLMYGDFVQVAEPASLLSSIRPQHHVGACRFMMQRQHLIHKS